MAKFWCGRDGNMLDLVPARGHERYAAVGQIALIRNVREHPIDMLLDRGTIEGYHHQAAERFLRDFELSQIGAARAVSFEMRVDGANGGGLSATQADAMTRVGGAISHLSRLNKVIIVALIVHRQNLGSIRDRMRELGLDWPPKHYAGPRLCEALDELAAHYGLMTRVRI